jgi:hypothetical protein
VEIYKRLLDQLLTIEQDLRSRWESLAKEMSALSERYTEAHTEWDRVSSAVRKLKLLTGEEQEVPY